MSSSSIPARRNSDEEIGSATSRDTVEELSREAAFVRVPEPTF